jgi:amino-acid N-acetyltransferase
MLRRAHMRDVPAIQQLINRYAEKDLMLPVSLVDLYDNLRDFFIFEEEEKVIGTIALSFTWEGLAEIRSLAVEEDFQGRGVARKLTEASLTEAREFDCDRVFTLTYVPAFFKNFGFRELDKGELPHKVWADCVKCPKFPDCGEVSLAIDL